MTHRKPALIVIAWDGKSPPLEYITADASAAFDILLFDYSGKAEAPAGLTMLSAKTECKGDIYREVHGWLSASAEQYEYIALLDDDIALSHSGINRLLEIAREHGLDSFAPTLSHHSHWSHKRFLHVPGSTLRSMDWVEVMMPFYRTELFLAGGAYFAQSISSYGLDQFAMATLQTLSGQDKVAVIDAVVADHVRPITSDSKTYSNGRNPMQERTIQRRMAMAQVAAERPDLIGTRWYFATFSPWGGPGRFWPLRLLAPMLWLRGRIARR